MRVVLLPGLDGTGLLFEPLRRSLSASIQTTVFDYPRDRQVSYDDLVAEIEPQLPRDEPFVLLGESYGGPLSIRLAVQRPAGLCGLILSASFVTCPHPYVPKFCAALVLPACFYVAPFLAKLRAKLGGYSSQEVRDLIDQGPGSVAAAVMAARVREVIRVDVTQEFAACPVPILYLQATHDFVVPASNLKRLQRIRPDLESHQFDAPHMILQTQAAAAATAIETFLTAGRQASFSG